MYDKFPYRDGEKMSKRKKNYPDPLSVVNKYGADALRYEVSECVFFKTVIPSV